MGDPLQCAICQAPATVHLTRIVDGKIHKMHLCEHCAGNSGAVEEPVFKLAEMLSDAQKESAPAEPGGPVCPGCGMSEAEFRKRARFGCVHCYDLFADNLRDLLPRIQPGLAHSGKHPAGARIHAARAELERRRDDLRKAVEAENYRAAADARDAIAALRTEIASLDAAARP